MKLNSVQMKDPEYREAYTEAALRDYLPRQLHFTREQRGLSRLQLAKKAGVSVSTIQRLEDYELTGVKLETLVKIANALQVCATIRFMSYEDMEQDSQRLSVDDLIVEPY